MHYYRLENDGQPVHEPDFNEWSKWMETANQQVSMTLIDGGVAVSTIFLGYSFHNTCPILWETAVLGGRLDQVRDRCAGSREQAMAMHEKMVKRVNSETA